MRNLLSLLIVAGFFVWSAAARAHESAPERGRFKLYLDANLMGFVREAQERTDLTSGDTDTRSTNQMIAGPFNSGGIGLGYAVKDYLVPQVYFSLQNVNNFRKGYSDDYALRFEFTPMVELVRPRGRVAPFASAGIALSGDRARLPETSFLNDEQLDARTFRVGPSLGAGLHIFLVSKAALDLGLRFTGVFTTLYNGHKLDEPRKWGLYNLMVTVGTSFWL